MKFEERDDVLIVGHDAVELLEQVEDDVRLPLHDRAAQVHEVVVHAERHHLVAGFLEMRDDVVLGAPLIDFLLGDAAQRVRRHERRVHQHQGAQLLHSATRGSWRSS